MNAIVGLFMRGHRGNPNPLTGNQYLGWSLAIIVLTLAAVIIWRDLTTFALLGGLVALIRLSWRYW